jgi:hypothetical protein
VKSGDLSRKSDCDELAGFLIATLQGAILQIQGGANRSPHRALQAFAFLDAPALNGLSPFGSVAGDYSAQRLHIQGKQAQCLGAA